MLIDRRGLGRFCASLAAYTAMPGWGQATQGATTAPSQTGTTLLERVQAASLERVSGELVAYFPTGAESKARVFQALVRTAVQYLDQELGTEAGVVLAVLDRATWNSLIPWQPYGIPGVAGRPPVIFVPADDEGAAAQDALSLEARVGMEVKQSLAVLGMSYQQAARRYVDLVALHELGHVYVDRLGIRPNSRWLNELLATYVGYAFMREREREHARLWDAMMQAYLEAVDPTWRRLSDFDSRYFGVGARNYVWYQAQFQSIVRRVYEARGLSVLADLRRTFNTATTVPMEPASIIARLVPYFPGVSQWSAPLME